MKDEETDDEDGMKKANQENDVFMIIVHGKKFVVKLPRKKNATFADVRKEIRVIQHDLDLSSFEFTVKLGDYVCSAKSRETVELQRVWCEGDW